MSSILEPPGHPAEEADLRTDLGRSLAEVLRSGILPFVRLEGLRRDSGADIVVVSVVPELPQDPVTDIRKPEHLAIRVLDAEVRTPEVYALREDFPSGHLHTNLTAHDCPWVSLCLYDESWEDLRLHVTAASLIARVQDWLSRAARGELHASDQPVEPFVAPWAPALVLPAPATSEVPAERFSIALRGPDSHPVFVATRGSNSEEVGHVAFSYTTQPAMQCAIRRHPADLEQLDAMLRPLGFGLVDALRSSLRELKEATTSFDAFSEGCRPVLVFTVPLAREEGSEPEGKQVFSYELAITLRELGRSLSVWDVSSGTLGLILSPDQEARGQGIGLLPLRPVFDLTPDAARTFSGLPLEAPVMAAVGVGALGSQVVMNLARSGFSRWVLIDEDSLLPHNLVRHALPRAAIGFPKAEAMGVLAASSTWEGMEVRTLVSNVLESEEEVADALRQVDVVLDMSASATVARALALDREDLPRLVSLFLNPKGTDLVVLAEDIERRIRLDTLEMQYYRALLRDPQLEQHLVDPTGRLRYGTSCRDFTVQIPQDQVAVAAGIGARAARLFAASPEARIQVWRMDEDMAVAAVAADVHGTHEWTCGSWTVVGDAWLLEHLRKVRKDQLPNETGGVLVGCHDQQRRRLYVADSLPAPPDSTERPIYFDRGCVGLGPELERISRTTGGALGYVGEWHSHPGRSASPSELDVRVLDHLRSHMATDGLPGLMIIVAEEDVGVFVDSPDPGIRLSVS